MFFRKKKTSYSSLEEKVHATLTDRAFHMIDGQLFFRDGDSLFGCEILEDGNRQFKLFTAQTKAYDAPAFAARALTQEEQENYETRSVMWLASLGKTVIIDDGSCEDL